MAAPSPAPWDRATCVTLILGTVTHQLQPEMGESMPQAALQHPAVRWVRRGQRCTVPGMGMAAGDRAQAAGGEGRELGWGGFGGLQESGE